MKTRKRWVSLLVAVVMVAGLLIPFVGTASALCHLQHHQRQHGRGRKRGTVDLRQLGSDLRFHDVAVSLWRQFRLRQPADEPVGLCVQHLRNCRRLRYGSCSYSIKRCGLLRWTTGWPLNTGLTGISSGLLCY